MGGKSLLKDFYGPSFPSVCPRRKGCIYASWRPLTADRPLTIVSQPIHHNQTTI